MSHRQWSERHGDGSRTATVCIMEDKNGKLWLWANGHNVSMTLTKKGEKRLREMLENQK